MGITLHHFEQPRSKPVLWLLEELKLPYSIGKNGASPDFNGSFDKQEKDQKSDSGVYAMIARTVAASLAGAVPPMYMPTLLDGNKVVQESGAIVEYLISQHGKGRYLPSSKSPSAQLDDTFFKHFAEGSFMPPLVLKLVFSTIHEQAPFFVRPFISIVNGHIQGSFIDPTVQNNFKLVDRYLSKDGGRQWLAGGSEPTGGDFMMSYPIETAVSSGAFKPDEIPQRMQDYLERLKARAAYQRATDTHEKVKADAAAEATVNEKTAQAQPARAPEVTQEKPMKSAKPIGEPAVKRLV